jgi:hypothetical protein
MLPSERAAGVGRAMAKRDWPLRFQCVHEGCTEHVTYRYETRRDLVSSYELKNYGSGKGWRCVRHSTPNEVVQGVRQGLPARHQADRHRAH